MKIYMFTEQGLIDAVNRSIELVEFDVEDNNVIHIIKDCFIEQAEKTGHIIDRDIDILDVLKKCFPYKREVSPETTAEETMNG